MVPVSFQSSPATVYAVTPLSCYWGRNTFISFWRISDISPDDESSSQRGPMWWHRPMWRSTCLKGLTRWKQCGRTLIAFLLTQNYLQTVYIGALMFAQWIIKQMSTDIDAFPFTRTAAVPQTTLHQSVSDKGAARNLSQARNAHVESYWERWRNYGGSRK